MVAARDIRACVVLVYGPKDARITRFGLRIRRRPARKTGTEIPDARVQVQVQARPVYQDEADLPAVLDEVRNPARREGERRGDWGGGDDGGEC